MEIRSASHYNYNKVFKLCLFLGIFGVHRYYVKRKRSGLLYQFTFGVYLIGWIYDLYSLINGRFVDSNNRPIRKDFTARPPALSPLAETDTGTMIILSLILGIMGVHRFWVGRIYSGAYFLLIWVAGIFLVLRIEPLFQLVALLWAPAFILWWVDFLVILFEKFKDAEGRTIRNPKQTRYDRKRYGR